MSDSKKPDRMTSSAREAQLRLTAVAEGIETQSQFDSLRSMGCDQFQGYLISHPVSAQDVRPFLAC